MRNQLKGTIDVLRASETFNTAEKSSLDALLRHIKKYQYVDISDFSLKDTQRGQKRKQRSTPQESREVPSELIENRNDAEGNLETIRELTLQVNRERQEEERTRCLHDVWVEAQPELSHRNHDVIEYNFDIFHTLLHFLPVKDQKVRDRIAARFWKRLYYASDLTKLVKALGSQFRLRAVQDVRSVSPLGWGFLLDSIPKNRKGQEYLMFFGTLKRGFRYGPVIASDVEKEIAKCAKRVTTFYPWTEDRESIKKSIKELVDTVPFGVFNNAHDNGIDVPSPGFSATVEKARAAGGKSSDLLERLQGVPPKLQRELNQHVDRAFASAVDLMERSAAHAEYCGLVTTAKHSPSCSEVISKMIFRDLPIASAGMALLSDDEVDTECVRLGIQCHKGVSSEHPGKVVWVLDHSEEEDHLWNQEQAQQKKKEGVLIFNNDEKVQFYSSQFDTDYVQKDWAIEEEEEEERSKFLSSVLELIEYVRRRTIERFEKSPTSLSLILADIVDEQKKIYDRYLTALDDAGLVEDDLTNKQRSDLSPELQGLMPHTELINIISADGKIRIGSAHSAGQSFIAQTMSRFNLTFLKRMPVSEPALKNQTVELSASPVDEEGNANVVFSADLSKATDPMSVSLVRFTLLAFYDAIDARWRKFAEFKNEMQEDEKLPLTIVPQWIRDAVNVIIRQNLLVVGKNKKTKEVSYDSRLVNCGALMGMGPGWTAMTLLNAHCAMTNGVNHQSLSVCGDDLIMLASRKQTKAYMSSLKAVALEPNETKSHVSKHAGIFCEEFIQRIQLDDSKLADFSERYPQCIRKEFFRTNCIKNERDHMKKVLKKRKSQIRKAHGLNLTFTDRATSIKNQKVGEIMMQETMNNGRTTLLAGNRCNNLFVTKKRLREQKSQRWAKTRSKCVFVTDVSLGLAKRAKNRLFDPKYVLHANGVERVIKANLKKSGRPNANEGPEIEIQAIKQLVTDQVNCVDIGGPTAFGGMITAEQVDGQLCGRDLALSYVITGPTQVSAKIAANENAVKVNQLRRDIRYLTTELGRRMKQRKEGFISDADRRRKTKQLENKQRQLNILDLKNIIEREERGGQTLAEEYNKRVKTYLGELAKEAEPVLQNFPMAQEELIKDGVEYIRLEELKIVLRSSLSSLFKVDARKKTHSIEDYVDHTDLERKHRKRVADLLTVRYVLDMRDSGKIMRALSDATHPKTVRLLKMFPRIAMMHDATNTLRKKFSACGYDTKRMAAHLLHFSKTVCVPKALYRNFLASRSGVLDFKLKMNLRGVSFKDYDLKEHLVKDVSEQT